MTGGAGPNRAGVGGGRVVVAGSVNTDLVARVVALPRPGETIGGERFATVGGGKGANAAVAAARLGAAVTLVARVGSDDFGAARLAELAREGIDLGRVGRVDGTPSGVALITVDAAGENSIVVVAGANGVLGPDAVADLALGPDDVLLTQLEIPLPTVEAALRRARERGARAILNAAPFVPDAAPLLPLADILIVNEIEAADLLGVARVAPEGVREAVAALLRHGPGAVALTLGPHGATVGTGGGEATIRDLPAPAVTPVDTTAAGDAFCGALAAELAAGRDFAAAARVAVIAGSLAVTCAGAQPSLPRREDVQRLLTGRPVADTPPPGG